MALSYSFPIQCLFLSLLLLTIPSYSSATTCSSESFSKNRLFAFCQDLPHLSSSLHWTYDSSKSSLDLAFVAPPVSPDGWIAWAINPTGTGMVGSQALIAFRQPDASMTVKTYNISAYGPVEPSPIAFHVSNMEGDLLGGVMRIFATISLPKNPSVLNHVWQVGSSVTDGVPDSHEFSSENLNSKGTLDLLKGRSMGSRGGDSRTRLRNIHGVLNALSWGILMPLGAVIARYLRRFQSAGAAWFYLHVSCQCLAYFLGVSGWATGLVLGNKSEGVQYSLHRNIGIALFCLGTLQVLALFLRPNPNHKYRIYWNYYHHSVGHTVIILSVINVFKGLAILDPDQKWRTAYMVLICIIFAAAILLEVITRIRQRRSHSNEHSKQVDRPNV